MFDVCIAINPSARLSGIAFYKSYSKLFQRCSARGSLNCYIVTSSSSPAVVDATARQVWQTVHSAAATTIVAIEQSRKGISEIEGKVARVATSESGTRASFKRPPIESQIVESYETSPEARRISEQAVDKRSERRGAGKNQ